MTTYKSVEVKRQRLAENDLVKFHILATTKKGKCIPKQQHK